MVVPELSERIDDLRFMLPTPFAPGADVLRVLLREDPFRLRKTSEPQSPLVNQSY